MEIEDVLAKVEEEPAAFQEPVRTGETFDVLSRVRIPELITLALCALGLAVFSVLLVLSRAVEAAIVVGLGAFGVGAFCVTLTKRLTFRYRVSEGNLYFQEGGAETVFPLSGGVVEPALIFSKAEGDFESIRLRTGEDKLKLPLPDRRIKGDLVRERFIAALDQHGAKVRLPGYLEPKTGFNDVVQVKVPSAPGGQGIASGLIFVFIFTLLLLAPTALFGLSVSMLGLVFVTLVLVVIALAQKQKGRTCFIVFSPNRLTRVRGKEVEWEVPREMLQGIVVESRAMPFKGTEVRVIAKTLYQRSLVIMDWSPLHLDARSLVLAHARGRGIPVEIRKGGEEPGDSLLNRHG